MKNNILVKNKNNQLSVVSENLLLENNAIKEMIYNPACLYPFSDEIYISYHIYSDKGTYLCGKAYYAATKDPLKPKKRGKILTKRISKGLHGNSSDEIIKELEKVPLYEDVYPRIRQDIKNHYISGNIKISLKTIWYYLRDRLKERLGYDEDLAVEIFSSNTELSKVHPDDYTGDEIEKKLLHPIKRMDNNLKLNYMNVLNIILDEAVKNGIILENKIKKEHLEKYKDTLTDRQTIVRNNLTKKSLEPTEEESIVRQLIADCPYSSLSLGILIRLFTGLKNTEVCALKWKDFEYNKQVGYYKFHILKYIDEKGIEKQYVMSDIEKYREIPLSPSLGKMIKKRKSWLMEKGVDEKKLGDYPIIMRREEIRKMIKGETIDFCLPRIIRKRIQRIIKTHLKDTLKIVFPEKMKESDLKRYLGDLLYVSFKYKALKVSCFELDELDYYLGLVKKDPFSRSYCGYSYDYIQLMMAYKLERWHSLYFEGNNSQCKDKNPKVLCGDLKSVPNALIIAENKGETPNMITLDIEADFGFSLNITKIS